MENTIIGSTGLRHRIMQLNAQRAEEEEMLKHDIKEIYYSFNLSTVIKRTVTDLNTDTEFKQDAVKTALNFGAGFVLDKVLIRKKSGLKSYLLNAGLKRVVSHFLKKK